MITGTCDNLIHTHMPDAHNTHTHKHTCTHTHTHSHAQTHCMHTHISMYNYVDYILSLMQPRQLTYL